jgi:hypothetical protein
LANSAECFSKSCRHAHQPYGNRTSASDPSLDEKTMSDNLTVPCLCETPAAFDIPVATFKLKCGGIVRPLRLGDVIPAVNGETGYRFSRRKGDTAA